MKEIYPCITCRFKQLKAEKVGTSFYSISEKCSEGVDIGGMGFLTECPRYKEKDITLVLKDFADSVQKAIKTE